MLKLTEQRFADYFRQQGETGMGYWIVTVYLRDGRVFPQAIVVGGTITQIKNQSGISFVENDIDRFKVTHDKWDWR
jgi:hypothetical protein